MNTILFTILAAFCITGALSATCNPVVANCASCTLTAGSNPSAGSTVCTTGAGACTAKFETCDVASPGYFVDTQGVTSSKTSGTQTDADAATTSIPTIGKCHVNCAVPSTTATSANTTNKNSNSCTSTLNTDCLAGCASGFGSATAPASGATKFDCSTTVPGNCAVGSSATMCTTCNAGYYLVTAATASTTAVAGSCAACEKSCMTCSGPLATNCLTCAPTAAGVPVVISAKMTCFGMKMSAGVSVFAIAFFTMIF